MSLFEALLGAQNPITQWTDRNSNLLTGLGTSLLSDGMNFAPAQAGAAMDQQAARQRDADAKVQAETSATLGYFDQKHPGIAAKVRAGMPVSEGWQEAMAIEQAKLNPPTKQNPYMSAGDGQFFNWQTGEYTSNPNAPATGGAETGFTPVWGTIGGKQTVALPGNDGKFYIDGTPIDSTEFVPTNPYDLNAQKSGGRAFGTATGGAQFSVPSAQLELKQSVDAIGNLQADDVKAGMEDWFKQWGALPRGAWVQGGSNMAKFQNAANNIIDRSWLSARAMLKGAGQVTDYEGTKAENAVSMMKTALEKGDKASYEAAVKDYEYWINQGFAKIQQQAGAMDGYGAGGAAPAGNVTSTGVPWSLD